MKTYKIANLNVAMNIYYDKLGKQALKYLTNDVDKPDIVIDNPKESYQIIHDKMYPYLSVEDIEYMQIGRQFYERVIDFDGYMMHSSAIDYEGNAYMFSAPSGTGKSTQTSNWVNYFGKDKIVYINDDKPLVRYIDNSFYCCGTPFSGKNDLSSNRMVKIKGIIFIKRGEINSCRKIDNKEAIKNIFNNSIQPINKDKMEKYLWLLDLFIKTVDAYELTCNMDPVSAKICYDFINKR